MTRPNSRLVYTSDMGRVCPGCGWPATNCQCSARRAGTEPVPLRVVAKLRMEKAGRGGKTVTVVFDLPGNAAFLKDLCSELKRLCGTGGAVSENTVELQGDLRERVRAHLVKKGWVVKG
ncbi:MAG: stress response translation initiation inhibitor YciH [Vicinamibacterales bacterium]